MKRSEEQLKYHSITKFLQTMATIFMIVLILWCFMFADTENTQIVRGTDLYLVDNWTYNNTEDISLPASIQCVADESFTISTTLPHKIPQDYAIAFNSLYSKCEVFAGNELIHTYGILKPLPFGRMLGNIRVIAPIDSKMQDKIITIRFTPMYSTHADISGIKMGNINTIKYDILSDNLLRLIICIFLLTILIAAASLAVYEALTKGSMDLDLLIYFCLFVLCVILWIICSSDIPQFFTSSNEAISLISFLSLSIISIPVLGFAKHVLSGGWRIFSIMQIGCWIIPLLNGFCFVLDICDPMTLLPITHISIIIGIIVIFFFAFSDWKLGGHSRVLAIAMIWLLFVCAGGLTCFFIWPSKGYDANVVGIGLIIFIFILFGIILHKQASYIEERQYLDVYKELAYTDVLTGIGNRTAFEQRFSKMHEENIIGVPVTLIMFDLNRLKTTNDEFGHQAGDEMIIGMGHCLNRAFGEYGTAYRLGGDEFAVIMIGHPDIAEERITFFKECTFEYNQNHSFRLSSAIGYAERPWNDSGSFFRVLFAEADRLMYEDKNRYKSRVYTDKSSF